ncbi:MAG: glucose-6-phosphate dehydrogenase [Candidatus Eisenbacteria bacterium]|nr:glucose-6-phosphate dehydrogenase [Candidatus Eisenbacteria bacterium]
MPEPLRIETSRPPGAPILRSRRPDPCAVVVFGANGDLAHRKLLPSLYSLYQEGELPEGVRIIGIGRSGKGGDAFPDEYRRSIEEHGREKPLDDEAWRSFAGRLAYLEGDVKESEVYRELRGILSLPETRESTHGNALFYMATPPDLFPNVLEGLLAAGLLHRNKDSAREPWDRIVVEKPFGTDLHSARELNRQIAHAIDERQVFRIDHYLGKEAVQNLLVFRFGNSIFEPLWNRRYIDHVEITSSESVGIEGRGRFYETVGALRDMIQSHVLQLLMLCAMDPPVSFESEEIRDQRARTLRALRPIPAEAVARHVVRGQYRGYQEEPSVAPGSTTETYVALRVLIDNWRWQGVPFYLRTGKRLRSRETFVAIHFREVPLCLFGRDDLCQRLEPNLLLARIQPDPGMTLRFVSKAPGDELSIANVTMRMDWNETFQTSLHDAYERLLLDCMRDDPTLFWRSDAVENSWAFLEPILEAWGSDASIPLSIYEPGSEGPEAAREMLSREGKRWTELG